MRKFGFRSSARVLSLAEAETGISSELSRDLCSHGTPPTLVRKKPLGYSHHSAAALPLLFRKRPALHLRFGQPNRPKLDGTHGRIPAHLVDPLRTVFRREFFAHDQTQYEGINKRDEKKQPEAQDNVVSKRLREQAHNEEHKHGG